MTTTQLTQLAHRLDTINQFKTNEVGQNRLVYSPTWVEAQRQVIKWGFELGFQVSVDDFGTAYLDMSGTTTSKTVIATGSHIDTVAQGENMTVYMAFSVVFRQLRTSLQNSVARKRPFA
ncbi:hypothetical protein [Lentilactobacillus parakefiri]|uniref:Allantoate amidohydrolase n=1 Tax=Lentilactobacillus parakefiri TaxID=152332 RepID=A0A224VIN1_9LACO|nr:hypothetical protein [Lentilactobacillus parakefiri]KRL58611.1 hydantoinase carbamoylase family amidase [Lentilactobacillus parakefiri DSM 10551]TDG91638.1 hypothetical protein C5L28_001461 [Lentilactobacillus parakefiri]GAW72134.1 allantoate amidohydrolase [Lentilactobacillus parakefiri]